MPTLAGLLSDISSASPGVHPPLDVGDTLVLWADVAIPHSVLSRVVQHPLVSCLDQPCSSL